MITRVEEIEKFVKLKCNQDFVTRFTKSKQLHVIVNPGNGRQVEEKHKSWTDGVETWYNFVVNDYEQSLKQIGFDFVKHVEAIGLTGWDWKDKATHWVGFDFDSITNHKEGLRDFEIKNIIDQLTDIDWVELRYSKSGKGIHVYVHFDPIIPTKDRNDHGALARAVIHKLSALVAFPFKDKVDVMGSNLWIWHKKSDPNLGFVQIKKSIKLDFTGEDWTKHIDVISKKATKTYINNQDIDDLANKKNIISLDGEHKKLIHWLQDNNCMWWWDQDRNLLVCHTSDLKKAHKDLGLKGMFDTVATGREKPDSNCYAFPIKHGGWTVRRFGKGVKETPGWDTDNSGWTRCYLNVNIDLKTAARCHGGLEAPSGAQIFNSADSIIQAAEALGVMVDIPPAAAYCEGKMKEHKDGRLIIEIHDKDNKLASQMNDWVHEGRTWKRIFNKQKVFTVEEENFQHDDLIRHIISQTGEDHGWSLFSDGQWNFENLNHVKLALESMGIKSGEVKNILGSNVMKYWKLVNIPFSIEYPGGRQWNRNSALMKFQPSTMIPESLIQGCPTWYKILDHIGKSLDSILINNEWGLNNGVVTGADYLTCWIASLFQEPTLPLPFLFLYGPENAGKSILHEALSELIIRGVVRADNALISQSNFNAELENAVLGVIEEINLGKNPVAANRIKDYVTSREIQIHRKGQTPYSIPNTLHFTQCSNSIGACPVFIGDSRIVVFYVEALGKTLIPKKHLIEDLIKEAPSFMSYILNLQIPKSNDRLNVPVITTSEKEILMEQNKTAIEMFLNDECHYCGGSWVEFNHFYDKFISYLGATTEIYSKIRVGKAINPPYLKGRNPTNNHVMVANLSFDKEQKSNGLYIINNDKLILTKDSKDEIIQTVTTEVSS